MFDLHAVGLKKGVVELTSQVGISYNYNRTDVLRKGRKTPSTT